MRKKLKISNKLTRGKTAGLNFIANWINPTSGSEGPIRPILDKIELILETMTGQPPRKKNAKERTLLPSYRKGHLIPLRLDVTKRSFFDYSLTPAERKESSSPAFAINLFNELVKEHPIPMKLAVQKRSGKIKVFPDHKGSNFIEVTLLLLWEYYFKDEGWQRLKRCPICEKWFVDDTRNKSKERCSEHCTCLWWTRTRRREAEHKPYGKRKVHKRKR